MGTIFISYVLLFIIALGSASGAHSSAFLPSKYTAEASVPGRVIVGNTDTLDIPIVVDIKTSDGEPFTSEKHGTVDFCTPFGVVARGVEVRNGRAERLVSFGKVTGLSDPFKVYVTQGVYPNLELLGQIDVEILHPKSYELLYDRSQLIVRADGIRQPRVCVLFKDQYGRPLDGLRVRVPVKDPSSSDEEIWAETDREGVATFILPARTRAEYEPYQILAGNLTMATQHFFVRYYPKDGESQMRALRDVIPPSITTLAWSESTRTATVKCLVFDLTVRDGDSYATVNGVRVPLDRPAMVRNGRIHLPASFLRQRLGLNA